MSMRTSLLIPSNRLGPRESFHYDQLFLPILLKKVLKQRTQKSKITQKSTIKKYSKKHSKH